MGIDIELFFKTENKEYWDDRKTYLGKVAINDNEDLPEATHHISSITRLYDFNYERGPWPQIASVIMELLADPTVEKIWYGGDSFGASNLQEMTGFRFKAITEHYLQVRHEPYLKPFREIRK